MTTIKIKVDSENNADLFWANLDEINPALSSELRTTGEATVPIGIWEVLHAVDGFADGPEYARTALIVCD